MSDWARLGPVGRDKLLTQLPRGEAPPLVEFAFTIKKVEWKDSGRGYRYEMDVRIMTADMQTPLGRKLWKLYPSMLDQEIIDAIDYEAFDDEWYICVTRENPHSKAEPKKTRFELYHTQQGMHTSGPSKPAAEKSGGALPRQNAQIRAVGSERGQPGAGERLGVGKAIEGLLQSMPKPPADPCQHPRFDPDQPGAYCPDCGERVG
jgi:hypothetical protein